MEKIKITREQREHLAALLDFMPTPEEEFLEKNTAEALYSAKCLLDEMEENIEALRDAVFDFETAIFDQNLDEMLNKLAEYVHLARRLCLNAQSTEGFIAGSLTRFIETTSDFTVTVNEEEIKKVLDREFVFDRVMSVGYKDGEYALLFGADEETIDRPPFIFAKGSEDCYDEAREYIEGLLDME